MKKLAPFLLVLATLCSCWDYTEIKDQTVVAGISVDHTAAGDGRYTVGLEILPMPAGEQEGIEPTLIVSDGKTVEEALYNVTSKLSYLPYVGHSWLILLSESVAREGIHDILNLITTHPDFYLGTYIGVVKNMAAADVYNSHGITTNIVAHEITGGFDADRLYIGVTTPQYAYQVFELLGEEYVSIALPALSVYTDEEGVGFAEIDGAAVLKDGRLVDYLSTEQTRMFNIADGRVREGIVALEVDGSNVDFKLRRCKAKQVVSVTDGVPHLTLRVSLDASTKTLPIRYDADTLEDALSRHLHAGLSQLVDTTKALRCDLLKVSTALHKQLPDEWEMMKDNWDEALANLGYTIELDINIID